MIKIAVKESDVLDLNVGGEKISVKRSTLTQIKGSLLESMFSGRWETSLERDKDGNIFLEFNPYCFKKLVDFLRAKRIETPDRPAPKPIIITDQQEEFTNLVAYLGLEQDMTLKKAMEIEVKDSFNANQKSTFISLKNENLRACNIQEGYHYVLGNLSFSSGVIWTLKVIKMGINNWMMIGIQNTSKPINTDTPYGSAGCYSWSTNGYAWINGVSNKFSSNKKYFVENDTLSLTLDLTSCKLSFLIDRTSETTTLEIPKSETWQLHVVLYDLNDEIQIVGKKDLSLHKSEVIMLI